MSTKQNIKAELKTAIRDELNQLGPNRITKIKTAYYQSVEALRTLANELEFAALTISGPVPEDDGTDDEEKESSELLDLHFDVCEALTALKHVEVLGELL